MTIEHVFDCTRCRQRFPAPVPATVHSREQSPRVFIRPVTACRTQILVDAGALIGVAVDGDVWP